MKPEHERPWTTAFIDIFPPPGDRSTTQVGMRSEANPLRHLAPIPVGTTEEKVRERTSIGPVAIVARCRSGGKAPGQVRGEAASMSTGGAPSPIVARLLALLIIAGVAGWLLWAFVAGASSARWLAGTFVVSVVSGIVGYAAGREPR